MSDHRSLRDGKARNGMYQISYDYAERPLPSDPQNLADIKHVQEHGYVIIRSAFSDAVAAAAKAEIRRLTTKDGATIVAGRNPFEGLNTNRIYSLLNKSRVFDDFAILPRVLALNDYFLDPGYQISAMHTITINGGEAAQELHHDDGFARLPRPRPPLGSAIIVAFDDFTEENGATRVVPGSHKWESGRRGRPEESIPAVMESGSVVYFLGTLWHGGGANRTAKPRHSMTVQYCQPYIRPIENQILAVDPRRLEQIPKRIVDMMGYRIHSPFIGYADGLSPRAGARRMVKWLQKPLDENPPTFAHRADSDSKL